MTLSEHPATDQHLWLVDNKGIGFVIESPTKAVSYFIFCWIVVWIQRRTCGEFCNSLTSPIAYSPGRRASITPNGPIWAVPGRTSYFEAAENADLPEAVQPWDPHPTCKE